jgi:NADPH-dependent 2,4-dienoyl-CoA reductase/sulfur reductase-like enzyme/rhodanese-related sulfurtransferase
MDMTEDQTISIIVVGASAAGLRAAARARRRLPGAKILVIDQGSFISYAACGMPYFVSGDIQGVDNLRTTPYGTIRDADFFREAKGLEVVSGTKVERIDRDAQKVYCKSMKTEETSVYSYDKLVLATGASPIVPPGVPIDNERITTFRSLENAISLRKSLETGKIEKAGIIGGGLIGCELAEAFSALWGAKVALIEAAPHILPGVLDPEMALAVEAYLKSENVEIHTNCPFEDVARSGEAVTIKTAQKNFEVDCAVMAVGVRPNSELAAGCGLVIGQTGGVVVDDRMATSDPNIFAAGDCVEVRHLLSGKSLNLPLGSLANRQGRIIGSNLGGGDERFGPVVGSAAVKLFDMNIAATGLMEASARDAGFNVGCVWGTFTDRADYYPEAQNIHFKLVFDKQSGRLLGLQGYGKGEVVKRIDVFSALLKSEGKLEDLMDMEFAYAPPYAPAVDPLYTLGCAARNTVLEEIQPIAPDSRYDEMVIIDLRHPDELKAAPLPEKDILKIPYEEIRRRWEEIPKDKPLVCICAKGVRSSESLRFLKEKGFSDIVYLGGGCLMRSEV